MAKTAPMFSIVAVSRWFAGTWAWSSAAGELELANEAEAPWALADAVSECFH